MMTQRFLHCTLAVCLAACAGRTTSLGGPEGTQSSASSNEGESVLVPEPSPAPPDEGMTWCRGYTWAPEATDDPCEYLIPPPAPGHDNEPQASAETWNPSLVTVEVFIPNGAVNDVGFFLRAKEECRDGDGWFYVGPAAERAVPSRFGICPKSCSNVAGGALLRMSTNFECGRAP